VGPPISSTRPSRRERCASNSRRCWPAGKYRRRYASSRRSIDATLESTARGVRHCARTRTRKHTRVALSPGPCLEFRAVVTPFGAVDRTYGGGSEASRDANVGFGRAKSLTSDAKSTECDAKLASRDAASALRAALSASATVKSRRTGVIVRFRYCSSRRHEPYLRQTTV
jgi:hypothetical protein